MDFLPFHGKVTGRINRGKGIFNFVVLRNELSGADW